jgi:hypothetical protein
MDIAVFQRLFGVIRLAWPGVEWIRVVPLFTLALWMGSADFYGSTSIANFGSSSLRGAVLGC